MRRTLVVLLVLTALLVIGAVYYALDPSASGLFPRCVFLSMTGYKCPGCGSQRAIHALLHGDVLGAFKYNALLLVAVPWIILCLYARLNAPLLIWLFLAMVLIWWLLRNIFNW